MDAAQALAGPDGVELHVRSHDTAAVAFYEALGFRPQQVQLLRSPPA